MVLWESSTMYRQNLMNSSMQPPLPGGPGGPVPGRPPQDMSAPSMLGQSQFAGPPMSKQNFPGPPLPGQQNLSQTLSTPGQTISTGSPIPAMNSSIQAPFPAGPGGPLSHDFSGPSMMSQSQYSGPPMSTKQNFPGPPLQHNLPPSMSSQGQINSGPPLPNSHPGGGPLPGHQISPSGDIPQISGLSISPAPALSGQQNSHPAGGPPQSSGPPTSGQPNSNSGGGPPLSGQQNSHPAGSPPLPGQQNSLSGPPISGQANLTGPPMPGQQNWSGSMPGQQNHSGNMRSSPLPGQQSHLGPMGGPPMTGQQNHSGPMGGPPMTGQQNHSGQMIGSHMPGQQSHSGPSGGPPLPGQQSHSGPSGGPPLPGQQNFSGQQNHSNSMGGQQNFSGPIGGQQNLSNSMGASPMPGQQSHSAPLGGPPMSGQQNHSGSLSGPPIPSQQSHSAQLGPPMSGGGPMGGQQNFPAPMGGPPLSGQQSFSGPMGGAPMHYPGQRNPLGQQSLPSMQPHLANSQVAGQNQYGQKTYMSGPPLPGQPGGVVRQQEAPMPGYQQTYQQGYQNSPDMYANQRSPYQGGYQQGQPQQQQQQQSRRLDPDHMPSPIQVIQDDRRVRGGAFITNQKGLVPPLVTTNFTVQDQGNASPRFVRSTMYSIPTTTDIMKQTSVPFSLILSPMARVEEGEYEPPIVDMGEIGPVRCIRCKAYMSPFMQFIDSGRRFQCLFCKATTDVPAEYFQHLDHTGQRMDRYERPELMLGSYEFIATKDYCPENKFPNPPAIIFLIDVTYNTIKSGLVNLICSEMKNIIRNLPIDSGKTRTNMKVGFITYNNTVHFYNVKSCLAQPQMMVVGDVQDVFMPLLDGFLCDAEESLEVINSLMSQIPNMFADTRETETILAPAIQAGLEALKASECSGKLLVFHSSLPIAEAPGKLKNRDDRKLLGTEKEKTVLAPQNNVYNTLGQDCVAAGCSVDLFVFNNSYIDIATIGQVSRLTGGEIYKYTYFQADIDGDRLIMDIVNNISRPIAFNAVMRVRTSTGVRPTDFYGHFYMSNTTDMELASIDCDKAVAIEIKHDDKLAEEEGVFIQAALLYTSCSGVRRLRVINLSLKTSSQMAELYRACDLDAIINFFSKQGVFKLLEHSPKAVKENLISRCANMLAAYRKNCASPSSAGQLILPECMKLLPLYVNCLMKSDAICGGADMTIDDRSYVMQAVSIMPVYTSVNYFYPRMLPLHNLDPQETDLPQMLRCSIDKITDDGCYLLENGIHMFVWLGLGLSSQWVQGVFGVPSVAQIDTDRTKIPILDTPLNKRVNEIINCVRTDRHHCMRLTMVRQRDKLEMVFRHFLVEDKGTDGSASYVDFLCHMHKEIRALLS